MVIKIDGKRFPNMLEAFDFGTKELEMLMKAQGELVFGPRIRIAETFPAPSFTQTFHDMLLENQAMPTQTAFVNHYMKVNDAEIMARLRKSYRKAEEKDFQELLKKGLIYRARRTYPSLVRDVHFSMKLKELGWDVFWHPDVDVEYKIDLVVKNGDTLYGVALYTNTKNGVEQRARKNKEHSMPDMFVPVEFPIDLSDGQAVGDFLMYGPNQIESLSKLVGLSACVAA